MTKNTHRKAETHTASLSSFKYMDMHTTPTMPFPVFLLKFPFYSREEYKLNCSSNHSLQMCFHVTPKLKHPEGGQQNQRELKKYKGPTKAKPVLSCFY